MARKRGRRSTGLRKRYSAKGAGALAAGRLQVVLFPRDSWAIEDALVWSSLQGFNTDDYDITDNYIRVHPHGRTKKAKRVKTIPYGTNGIRAVVEWR